MSQYVCYIVECADGTLYTGITNNLSKRIDTHNNGKGAKYTKTRLPVKLLGYIECKNKSSALSLEIKVKKLTRVKKLEIIGKWLML